MCFHDRDLQKLSQGGRVGRKGDFTSENILRALMVQHVEGLPFREAVIRMDGDGFLQDFLRTRKKAVMDYSFLDKCSLARCCHDADSETLRPELYSSRLPAIAAAEPGWSHPDNGRHLVTSRFITTSSPAKPTFSNKNELRCVSPEFPAMEFPAQSFYLPEDRTAAFFLPPLSISFSPSFRSRASG